MKNWDSLGVAYEVLTPEEVNRRWPVLTTEEIGIALIFGAFVMGLIMPRHAELTEDVTRRIEDFVVTLLLEGLRPRAGRPDRQPEGDQP